MDSNIRFATEDGLFPALDRRGSRTGALNSREQAMGDSWCQSPDGMGMEGTGSRSESRRRMMEGMHGVGVGDTGT